MPLLLSLLIGVANATAQDVPKLSAASYEGQIVGRVDFDPPDQPLPRAALDKLLPFHAGTRLKLADVRTAIQNLYQTGRFANISISAFNEGTTLVVNISTEFSYFVGQVTIEGVQEPPNKGQLSTASKLELGTPFEDNDMEQAVQNMIERMRANGFHDAKIDYTVNRNRSTEEAAIHFDITAGKRSRFDGVTLTGKFTKTPESIIKATHWRRGFLFLTFPGWRFATESRVSAGVASVRQDFQKGDHLEAQVTLEKLDYNSDTNTERPSLSIENGPIVKVLTTGAKVSRGKLKQLIPVFEERTVDRTLLVEGQRNLVEYFQSQGYFDSEVNFSDDRPSPDLYSISYAIQRNQRYKLEHIAITGNSFFHTDTLRERMYITPASFPRFRYGRYSQKLLERDKDTLKDLYKASGFLDVDIDSTIDQNYRGKNGELGVVLAVKEGPQWLVGKLDFEGIPAEDLKFLSARLQSSAGEPFSAVNIAADRDMILSYFYNNGYPDAAFDFSQTPAEGGHRVNLKYTVRLGKRVYVRSVLVRGLETTRPKLVDERIIPQPGNPLSQQSIASSQQKLYDLGIFSKVQTAIQNPGGDEDQKYVLFQVDEASRYSMTLGFGAQLARIGGGVTTFDDPAGSTGFAPRVSVGISRLNLFGLGQTLSLNTLISTIEQRAVLTYLIPRFVGNEKLTLTISGLFDNAYDIRTFQQQRAEGAIQLAERISRQYQIQYRFALRHVTISDLKISPELIPLLSQPVRVGIASTTFIQDRRDDPIDSHRGMYNTIDVGLAARGFGSETDFTRLLIRNTTYHPVGKNIVIARNIQFGYIQRLGGLQEIPLAERWYSGGSTSNRAFPDNQAGPRDLETGFPIGGNAMLFHSTEIRFPLIGDNLRGVLFHDIGNVYSDINHISFRFRQHDIQDFDYAVQAVGFGIRYRTPIGPIRADFSFSPDAPRFYGFAGTYEQLIMNQGVLTTQKINLFQFHFSLGQTY
ncbi:MAG TPA: outer membrane protein assembly factor BamA [Bryobacteraceae bacterium]|nr:outer membrane protein assembly factor BamA [Bryobacteraceae bacterium]